MGLVTNPQTGRIELPDALGLGSNRHSVAPQTKRFITPLAMFGGRDQMAAGVEGVVDGHVD